jgi:hypothetical protein
MICNNFDSAAKHNGDCLNDSLEAGPVSQRFIVRYPVAVSWKTCCTCGQGRRATTTGGGYSRCNNPNEKSKKAAQLAQRGPGMLELRNVLNMKEIFLLSEKIFEGVGPKFLIRPSP